MGSDYDGTPEPDTSLVWATKYSCLGIEDKLIDCILPEEFGEAVSDGYDSAPGPAGAPSTGGVHEGCNLASDKRLAVVCRNFPFDGAKALSHLKMNLCAQDPGTAQSAPLYRYDLQMPCL